MAHGLIIHYDQLLKLLEIGNGFKAKSNFASSSLPQRGSGRLIAG